MRLEPGKLYFQGSLLILARYDDYAVLDAEVESFQEAADITYDLDPNAWVYINLPVRRLKRKANRIGY